MNLIVSTYWWDVYDELAKQGIFDYILQHYEQCYHTCDFHEVQAYINGGLRLQNYPATAGRKHCVLMATEK